MIEMTAEEARSKGVSLKKSGPQNDRTRAAQRIVEEFAESGADVAEVDWREVCDDFKRAKHVICSRLPHLRLQRDDADDIGVRSSRDTQSVYLVHKDRV